jgi:tetratricopeptide (TPR) repeat protein
MAELFGSNLISFNKPQRNDRAKKAHSGRKAGPSFVRYLLASNFAIVTSLLLAQPSHAQKVWADPIFQEDFSRNAGSERITLAELVGDSASAAKYAAQYCELGDSYSKIVSSAIPRSTISRALLDPKADRLMLEALLRLQDSAGLICPINDPGILLWEAMGQDSTGRITLRGDCEALAIFYFDLAKSMGIPMKILPVMDDSGASHLLLCTAHNAFDPFYGEIYPVQDIGKFYKYAFDFISNSDQMRALALVSLGQRSRDSGRYSEAERLINQAIMLCPGNAHYYSCLASVYFALKEYEKAYAALGISLSKMPYFYPASYWRAKAAKMLGGRTEQVK